MRRPGIAGTYMIFDLLSLDGRSLLSEPYAKSRAELEALALNDLHWQTPETFDDGEALWEAVCEHELEGVVAKRRSSRYAPAGASVAGSRRRTVTTGVTRWSARARSSRAVHASSLAVPVGYLSAQRRGRGRHAARPGCCP